MDNPYGCYCPCYLYILKGVLGSEKAKQKGRIIMSSKTFGRLFMLLMICLVAYGSGSCANVLNSEDSIIFDMVPLTFALNNQPQITIINDASFEPAHVWGHYPKTTSNITNTTNSTTG